MHMLLFAKKLLETRVTYEQNNIVIAAELCD